MGDQDFTCGWSCCVGKIITQNKLTKAWKMSGGTLDGEVARAQVREAREARHAGLGAPSYHLGGPPEPWELAIGDTSERVGRQGRAVIGYAAKMQAMGVDERSLAGETNPVADHVAAIGREKMRLLSGAPSAPTTAAAASSTRGVTSARHTVAVHKGAAATDASATDEDTIAEISSDDGSDFSEDDGNNSSDNVDKQAPAPPVEKPAAAGGHLDPDPDDEASGGIELMDDPDIRNAVEDFDSRNWTMDQLEVSCQTLLEECYASEDRRRRLLSAGMLRKLVELYPSALRWMQRNLEAVVNDGLPGMVKGTLAARVFKLDILLGILAPAMAESMTQLNVVPRVLRLMVFRMDTAVRLISFRYTLPRQLAHYRKLPSAISTHKRMTLLMQGSELRARWRNVNADQSNGRLPPSLLHAYLSIILSLIDMETCPQYFRMNRVKVVGGSGLLALAVHFKSGDRSQRLACRILRELAREPLVIYELLKAGVAEYVSRLLPKLRMTSTDRLLEALDALDSMAFSAMRLCVLSCANPDRGQGNSALVAALVAEGSSIGGLESEIRVPTSDKAAETVRLQLGLPHLVTSLTDLLEETDVQLYLAGLVILGKLASTACYHSVLQELLAYAGRALELLVQGLQSQEEIVPEMALALFLQLCSRQEGREGIEASEGGAMLLPLVSGGQAQESPIFLRGLACAIALARRGPHGPPPGSTTAAGGSLPPSAPAGLSLPRPGGVGLSGPAKPHPLDLEGKLYNDLVDVLDAPPPVPLEGVRGLVRMGFLEAVMRFLVREDDEGDDHDTADGRLTLSGGAKGGSSREGRSGRRKGGGRGGVEKKTRFRARGPYYFSLKQRHACLGAVALHGLVVLVGPHPTILSGQTLRYLCYSIQVAYIDLTVGRLAPGMGYPLLFRSIQLACRALAFLAASDDSQHNAPLQAAQKCEDNDETVEGDDGQQVEGAPEGGVVAEYGSLRRVVDSLFSTTAMKEVACMAQMPSRTAWDGDDGYMFRQLERTVSSAAILIAGVCPVPAGERNPFVRFDQPEDEQLSLKLWQALMERLVKAVGGPLCSTLLVADNLEIIAHTCRALSKLSAANSTAQVHCRSVRFLPASLACRQMLLDSHGAMKAIIRLGPKVPANLPAVEPEEQEAGTSSSISSSTLHPSRTVGSNADAMAAGKRELVEHPGGIGDHSGGHTRCQTPGRVNKHEDKRTAARRTGDTGGVSGYREGGQTKQTRTGEGIQVVERKSREKGNRGELSRPSPWSGYDIREGEIADASTRKLCSLPFYYYRFVSNVARVPSGRAVVQSSGTLKRCLERLALDVSGSVAARLATLRCRSEICVLVARMAGTYDRDTGTANDFILSPRYRAVRVMLGVLATCPEDGAMLGGSRAFVEVARYNAACALAELCRDVLKAVPLTADAGGIHLACKIANDPRSPMPLLKQVLRILQAAGSFPDRVYASSLADPALLRSLHRIANNAYPGFRPPPAGRETPLSPAFPRKNAQTLARKQTAAKGGGGLADTRTEVPPPSAFGLLKPRSAEAQLISDLAREVAYLIGVTARPLTKAGPSPLKREENTATARENALLLVAPPSKHAREVKVGPGKSTDPAGAEDSEKSVDATGLAKKRVPVGDGEDIEVPVVKVTVPTLLASQEVTGEDSVLGRPGTYLGCGVTTCSGLGVTGEHGDTVAGNVPHPAFVLRRTDDHGGDARRDTSCINRDNKVEQQTTTESLGSNSTGLTDRGGALVSPGRRDAEDERHVVGSILLSNPRGDIVATPLALLSAREASFRTELIRRKEHYKLGGTGKEGNLTSEGSENPNLGGSEELKAPAPLAQDDRQACSLRVAEEEILTTPPRRVLRGKSKRSPGHVYVSRSPLMASTRPTGAQPLVQPRQPLDEGNGNLGPCTAVTHPTFPNSVDERDRRKVDALDGTGSSLSPPRPGKGGEFVSFARPAAHWSITVGVGARGRGASPDGVQGKGQSEGLRIANVNAAGGRGGDGGGSGGDVVGRFACRGYLLDPTFADSNPIILHPRLPRISGGRGLSQVIPESSTLADHIASQVAKGATDGRKGGIEPYRNVVDVLRHHVDVSGGRPAGVHRYFSEQGRPLSPVNFQHVYDSVEKRKRDHVEPHLVVFP